MLTLLQPLMFIADNMMDDLHMTFHGDADAPLHFSLTKNQKDTIKLFVELFAGDQLRSI